MKQYIYSIILTLAGFMPVNAQLSFTVSGEYFGNCGGHKNEIQNRLNSIMSQYKTQATGIRSSAECEKLRAEVNGINYNYNVKGFNCGFRLKAGPCTGRPVDEHVISLGQVNIQGPEQGSSFFSTNGADEIQNWSEDELKRRLALDKSSYSSEPTNVSTGDSEFDEARKNYDFTGRMPAGSISLIKKEKLTPRPGNSSVPYIGDGIFKGIQKPISSPDIAIPNEYYFGEEMSPNDERWNYFLEKEFTDELHSEFFQEKKINIEDILQKDNKTQFELDLIRDYEIWRDNKLAESELYKNMAICSAMSYVDADISMLTNNSDFIFLSKETPESQRVLRAMQLIESCNNDNQNEGFHADMFYNEKTGEYVVSFRGTEATWEDIKTDIEQGAGVVPTQYRMAIEIGDVIRQIVSDNPDIKICITGHSLGGGLATIAGVVSGQPTVVFNPAGVHKNTFEYAGVSDKVAAGNYNIVRISDTHDILTNAQENTALSPVRESARALLFSAAKYKTKDDIISANYASSALPSATGQLKVIDSGHKGMLAPIDGHRIVPMAEKLIATHKTFENSMKSDDNLRQFRVYINE